MNNLNSVKTPLLKVGIFGASFDPLHLGHLNLLQQVQDHFSFDLIKIIPNWQSPLAYSTPIMPPKTRLALVKKLFKGNGVIEVDDQEIKKKTLSYTIDTLKNLNVLFKDIYLIIGIDQFVNFDKWKDFEEIIKISHVVVCSRKGYIWDKNIIPSLLQPYKKTNRFAKKIPLITGKNIYGFTLKNKDISSLQIRSLKNKGLSISHLVPPLVDTKIQELNLYKKKLLQKPSHDTLIKFCVNLLSDKKAQKIKVFDLRSLSGMPFSFSIVLSGFNTIHTKTMATFLHKQIEKEFCMKALNSEGQETGEWIILDYGELVVHIFYDYTREYYKLEELWTQNRYT